jgi:hypothetical protein
MGSVYNYNFDNNSRSGDDNCNLSAKNVQNNAMNNYLTTNYFSQDQCMNKSIAFAVNQPNVFYNGGYEGSSCNIDTNSSLKIGSIQTHPKCRISLLQRPFVTVPYLGKGPQNPELEFNLQNGQPISQRKSESSITDKNVLQYSYTPQLPTLSATIQNASNLVEEVADEGWIRGGIPTKDIVRQNEYVKKNNS